MAFVNARQLGMHFGKHGSEFGATSPQEYEQLADMFLVGALRANVQECRRTGGDVVRFDPASDEYGVIDRTGIVRTYFKPVPCSTLSASVRVAARQSGKCHGSADNVSYFYSECSKY
jgi:hypothetical protein